MADVFAGNEATSAEEAAKIIPRAEFRVFGQGILEDVINRTMWKAHAKLFKIRTSRIPSKKRRCKNNSRQHVG